MSREGGVSHNGVVSADILEELSWRGLIAQSTDLEALRERLAADPHSPDEIRCNQTVRNINEFHEAFNTTPGDRLWLDPSERVRIW